MPMIKISLDDVIIVSRHKYFIDFVKEKLKKMFEINEDELGKIRIVDTVMPKTIKGKFVITSGLPIHIMKHAKLVMLISIDFPRDPNERAKIIEGLEKGEINYDELKYSIEIFRICEEDFTLSYRK